jgi:hypothetical protein
MDLITPSSCLQHSPILPFFFFFFLFSPLTTQQLKEFHDLSDRHNGRIIRRHVRYKQKGPAIIISAPPIIAGPRSLLDISTNQHPPNQNNRLNLNSAVIECNNHHAIANKCNFFRGGVISSIKKSWTNSQAGGWERLQHISIRPCVHL